MSEPEHAEEEEFVGSHVRQRVRASFVLWRAIKFALDGILDPDDMGREWLEKAAVVIRQSGFALVELPDKPEWPTDQDEKEFDEFVMYLQENGRGLSVPLD